MAWFFALFLFVPLIEIYLLIEIGSEIGALSTIALVMFTAFLGAVLVRAQGFSTFERVRGQVDRGEVPALEMIEALCLFVAGALLLTPGFFTDAVGFALLIPPLRRKVIQSFLKRRVFHTADGHRVYEHTETRTAGDRQTQTRVIDVDYRNAD